MGQPMDRSQRIFAPQTDKFAEAFPTLEDAVLEYIEYDFGQAQTGKRWHSLRTEGGLMRCGNSRCHRGGYEIDREVRRMIRENVAEQHVEISCPGDEGTPKRKRGDSCDRSIEGTLTLKFKEPQTSV
jgi:hypothetical protein